MTTPLIIWFFIMTVITVILAIRIAAAARHSHLHPMRVHSHTRHQSHRHSHPFVSIGTEREELFVPGDPMPYDSQYDEQDL